MRGLGRKIGFTYCALQNSSGWNDFSGHCQTQDREHHEEKNASEKSLRDIGSLLTAELRSKSAFSAVHYITQEGGGKSILQKVRTLLGAGFVAVVGDSGDQPAAVAMDQVCDVGAAVSYFAVL